MRKLFSGATIFPIFLPHHMDGPLLSRMRNKLEKFLGIIFDITYTAIIQSSYGLLEYSLAQVKFVSFRAEKMSWMVC